MDRQQLEEMIAACDGILAGIKQGDQAAIDTAQGLIRRWVDIGNETELTNLLGAIRLTVGETMHRLQAHDQAAVDEARKLLWQFTSQASVTDTVNMLLSIKSMTLTILEDMESEE